MQTTEPTTSVRITARGDRFDEIRQRIRSAGGQYDPDMKAWIVSRSVAIALAEESMDGDIVSPVCSSLVRITARGDRFDEIRQRIRSAGGQYDPGMKAWIVSRRAAASLAEESDGDIEIL
jgi:hypothetical protein